MADRAKTNVGGLEDRDGAASDIKSDLARLRADLQALKSDIAALGSASAKDAREGLKAGLSSAEDQAREALETASTELEEIQRQAEKAVRKKPLTTVAAALAIGYFIGGLARK